MIDSTGPKISSRAMVMSLRTLVNSVGRTNQPSSPSGLPRRRQAACPHRCRHDITLNAIHCFWLTIGPTVVAGSRGSPVLTCPTPPSRAPSHLADLPGHEDARAAMQACPPCSRSPHRCQRKSPAPMSASSRMTVGDLPPSSSVILFIVSARPARRGEEDGKLPGNEEPNQANGGVVF